MCTQKIPATKLVAICACFLLWGTPTTAQQAQQSYYISPLRIPTALSGNFGELRSNHLHSGLDFRVGGVEGEPVYAVASGHIYRIVVRPDGYGKALYIRHTNGTSSVYAHLRNFAPHITRWAQEQQYQRKSFVLDTEVDTQAFPVRQGDLIGNAGNSGSSSGPHLHFEIRDRSQRPINVVQNGTYRVNDKTPPVAFQLITFRFDTIGGVPMPREDKSYAVRVRTRGQLAIPVDTITVSNPTYFSLNMRDMKDGSQNIFGVYNTELRVNNELVFSYQMDKFSFDETRYANAMQDFGKNSRFVRLYVAPGNKLSIYRTVINRGLVTLKPNEVARISIVMTDDSGNTATLAFWARGEEKPSAKQLPLTPNQRLALYTRNNTFEIEGFRAVLSAGTLYEDGVFEVQPLPPAHGSLTPIYAVRQPLAPPHRTVSISIMANVPERLRSKATIASLGSGNTRTSLATTYTAPYFNANIRGWGSFFVAVDTAPPVITPVNFTANSRLTAGQRTISLRVTDDFNRLVSYAGYIDGQWALFDYDAKTNTMTYEIDPTRVKTGVWHTLVFVATDGAGNQGRFESRVFF